MQAIKSALCSEVQTFVRGYAERRGTETNWRRPLVRFASATDPLFMKLKTVVRPTHAMPTDLLDGAATVVVFFLPFLPAMAQSNVAEEAASREWATAYGETNRLIADVCAHLVDWLESQGHAARGMAATANFTPEELMSDWSHRHVGWIAGLGTFGLNNMFITESGCCGRLGTLVTSAQIAPDPRPAEEACLYRRNGTCKQCVTRCPSGALREDGFDRHLCYKTCLRNAALHAALGGPGVCGKCTVGVPCAHARPA
jgi:epoxyqueuosine reductase QueG